MQPKDKSVAVGLELTLVGLIAYVPANLVYQLMAGRICYPFYFYFNFQYSLINKIYDLKL